MYIYYQKVVWYASLIVYLTATDMRGSLSMLVVVVWLSAKSHGNIVTDCKYVTDTYACPVVEASYNIRCVWCFVHVNKRRCTDN